MSSFPESALTPGKIIHSHHDLIVWQKSVELVVCIYEITAKFPKEEIYGLISQMRRSAVSIPSNIAEGRRRGSRKEFNHFLHIAFGSAAELETQIEIAKRIPFMQSFDYKKADALLNEVMRMLYVMVNKFNKKGG